MSARWDYLKLPDLKQLSLKEIKDLNYHVGGLLRELIDELVRR
jgi:hypothetical protein